MHTTSEGRLSLEETLHAIRYHEARGYELVAFMPGSRRPPTNSHCFVELDEPGARPRPLEIVPIEPGEAGAATIAERHKAGWELAIYGHLYALGTLTRVAAFRMNHAHTTAGGTGSGNA